MMFYCFIPKKEYGYVDLLASLLHAVYDNAGIIAALLIILILLEYSLAAKVGAGIVFRESSLSSILPVFCWNFAG